MRMERRLRLGELVLHPLTDNLCRRLLGCARRAAGYRLQPHAAAQRNADARPAAGDGRRCVVPFGAQTRGGRGRPSIALFPFQKLPESGAVCYMPHLIFPEFAELLVRQRRGAAGCSKCGFRQRCAGFEGLRISLANK